MRIGEVARRSGVSARSLRYYEQQGLLSARRGPNGYRDFDDGAVERARILHLLFGLGIPRALAESVLTCSGDVPTAVHAAVRTDLAAFRDRLDERIEELQRTRAAVSRVVDAPAA